MSAAVGKLAGLVAAIVLTICSLGALTLQQPLNAETDIVVVAPYIIPHHYNWVLSDWMPPPRLPRFLRPQLARDGLSYTSLRVIDREIWLRRID
jgi:hypothetical protein